jgi:hypothetical protein
MRKALLIVAMLLLVTPVMATTTITTVNEGVHPGSDGNYVATVRIDYSGTAGVDVNVRAFALDINIDGNSTFSNIRDFNRGEANGTIGHSGYGIFPSRFRDFVNPLTPDACYLDPNYNPTTAWNEPETTDHNSGMGYKKMIVEMGTLYVGDANRPTLSGTSLCRFDVNSWGQHGTYHLAVTPNALRGGVVNSDGNTITSVTSAGVNITFPCIVPNVVNEAEAQATTDITNAGFTLGTRTTTCSNSVAAGNIISTNPAANAQPGCGTAVAYVVSTGVCASHPILNGAVTLQNLNDAVNGPVGETLTIQIYSGATLVETGTTTLGTSGSYTYTCTTANAGTYDIKFKVSHWLKKKLAGVVLVAGSNSLATPSLLNGDINGDNLVGLTDLNLLKANYGKAGVGLAGDLNKDNLVGLTDLNILKGNYGKAGD